MLLFFLYHFVLFFWHYLIIQFNYFSNIDPQSLNVFRFLFKMNQIEELQRNRIYIFIMELSRTIWLIANEIVGLVNGARGIARGTQ